MPRMGTQVAILMGSDSDLDQVRGALPVLDELEITYEVRVLSAHRTPKALHEYVENSPARVFTAAARGGRKGGGDIVPCGGGKNGTNHRSIVQVG